MPWSPPDTRHQPPASALVADAGGYEAHSKRGLARGPNRNIPVRK